MAQSPTSFIVTVADIGLQVSHGADPSDADAYKPIYLEVDSTPSTPDPSAYVHCYLQLPAGFTCLTDQAGNGGATVSFVGRTANYWEITSTDPLTSSFTGWVSQIVLSVDGSNPQSFWVRTNTAAGEVPVDDRSVSLRITGQIRAASTVNTLGLLSAN